MIIPSLPLGEGGPLAVDEDDFGKGALLASA